MPRYNQYPLLSGIQADDIILIWETGTQSNKTIEFQAILDSVPGGLPANPISQIGLTTINGSANTFMRSDAAPRLNQAINPVWTGGHVWQTSGSSGLTPIQISNSITVGSASSANNTSFYGATTILPSSTANLTASIFGGGLTNLFVSNYQGSGILDSCSGVFALILNGASDAGTGNINSARVFHAGGPSVASGKTTDQHFGLHVRSGNVSGTLNTFYGVFIDNNTSAGTNYGIYSQPALNRFNGRVTIGAASTALVIENSQTPALAGASGTAGTICWDSSYIYVCVSANTWKRSAISTW